MSNKDAAAVAALNAQSTSSTSQPIELPAGYRVLTWKVRPGAAVRVGETVVLAVPVATPTVSGAEASASNAQHKRPKLRRRPAAAAAAAAATTTSSEGADDDCGVEKVINTNGSGNIGNPSQANAGGTMLQQILGKMTTAAAVVVESESPNTREVTLSQTEAAHINAVGPTSTSFPSTTTHQQQQPKQLSIHALMDGIVHIRPLFKNNIISTEQDSKIIIGTIEPCPHPTVVEGLCAVCGSAPQGANRNTATARGEPSPSSSLDRNDNNNNNNNNPYNHQHRPPQDPSAGTDRRVTVAGWTVTVSEEESRRMAAQDAARLHGQKKLSLVLDLDHTLVHATADPRAQPWVEQRDDVRTLVLPLPVFAMDPQQQQQSRVLFQHHYVKLRPHVREFLQMVQDSYELGVYTAGTREYAEEICRLLARHVLQAPCDDVSLHQLRNRVGWLQHQWDQQQQSDENGREEKNEASHGPTAPETKTIENKSRNSNCNGGPGKKRKRVAFAATSDATHSSTGINNNDKNRVTLSQLEEARVQLAEAERLDQSAAALRQKLFGSRVCSRTDAGDLGAHVKSLRRIFPCGGSMAAVVDDREDVWANGDALGATTNDTRRGEPPENLLLVRPYHWSSFDGFAEVNNAAGVDLAITSVNGAGKNGAETNANVPTERDDQLLATADILKRLHQRYYSQTSLGQLTVPEILQQMRSQVLAGCEVVLSGLVPLHKQEQQQSNSQAHRLQPRPPYIRYAENLGATVATQVTARTTHVVAAKDGTDKILQARRSLPHCHIVQAAWLVDCFRTLSRCDEHRYLLNDAAAGTRLPRASATNTAVGPVRPLADSTRGINSPNGEVDDDDDDDDDGFAEELENEMMGQQDVDRPS